MIRSFSCVWLFGCENRLVYLALCWSDIEEGAEICMYRIYTTAAADLYGLKSRRSFAYRPASQCLWSTCPVVLVQSGDVEGREAILADSGGCRWHAW
jgi:hypothetical protein